MQDHDQARDRARAEGSSLEITPAESRPVRRAAAWRHWLLAETQVEPGRHRGPHGRPPVERQAHWLRVMCLSGLDYFSTLGYQPAIAALAVGVLAPLATLVLVLVTLLVALPVYRAVAALSPHGAGSIAILARLFGHWGGKLIVLFVLGSAAADFMLTMTLSSADAAAHLMENPLFSAPLEGRQVPITLVLLAGLGVVFLRGMKEAINVAAVLVPLFLAVNLVVVLVALAQLATRPIELGNWWQLLSSQHGNPFLAVALALLVFPKLALGLSGFETGVAVMPQLRSAGRDAGPLPVHKHLPGRIRNARKLLLTSALIMSGFLVTSSITTVTLIPAREFEPGGAANGRALAYLAHEYLGAGFGTIYDLVTIAILWFAGASAMAGLLNLIPRYLPRLGMAPSWAEATRPLVLIITAIAFAITLVFDANVDAQGGAYATGVLILISSAAVAVMLVARRERRRRAFIGFAVASVIFVFTTLANIVERPEGIKIVALFVAAILVSSFASRIWRSTELRAPSVTFDPAALQLLDTLEGETVRLLAHDPVDRSSRSYRAKLEHARLVHHLTGRDVVFIEVEVPDSSEFENELRVRVQHCDDYRVLRVQASTIPNAIAAISLVLHNTLGYKTHVYFRWDEGRLMPNLLRFLFFGDGAIAAMTREVLRAAEPQRAHRPWVHVG